MRIVFVAGRYWPATGGAENLIHHVARELARRHDVTVIAHRIDDEPDRRLSESLHHPPPFTEFRDGHARVVPVALGRAHRLALTPLAAQVTPGLARYAYGRLRIPMLALYARVVSRLHAPYVGSADLVHAWTTSFAGAAAMRAARSAGRPVVMTPFVHRGQWGDDLGSRRLLRRADRIIGLLDAERDAFRAMGIPEARLATCGVCAPQLPTGGGDALRARYGIQGPLVLFLGVRRPYKGHDLLLAAAGQVAQEVPGVTFAFVGPGPSLAADGAGARVIDVGPVDSEGRGSWLEAADILCLPSAHEIFPLSVLEAWSTRTPVVVSDLPPLVELMQRTGGGVTVQREPAPIAAVLVELLKRPEERRRLAAAGYAFWRRDHTPAVIAARHEGLYEDVLSEGRA
jgi:glycosyltransferase involved in cell wall biosynthesis